jgi:hypothetical protein
MRKEIVYIAVALLAMANNLIAQTPILQNRKQILTPKVVATAPPKEIKTDTIPPVRLKILPGINKNIKVNLPKQNGNYNTIITAQLEKNKLLLQTEKELNYGQEFTNEIDYKSNVKYGRKEWNFKMGWWNNDASIQFGRVEISTLPFPPFEVKDFSGIVQSYIIAAPQKDSLVYDIAYNSMVNGKVKDAPLAIKTGPINSNIKLHLNAKDIAGLNLKMQQKIETLQLIDIKTQPTKSYALGAFINNYNLLAKNNNLTTTDGINTFYLKNQILSALFNTNTDSINYYIRIVPLNGRKYPVAKPTNTVAVKWDSFLHNYFYPPKPCEVVDHLSDYTITNIEYTPAHFPERDCTYSNDGENIDCKNCVVVATIIDAKKNEGFKTLGVGVNIGDRICPAKKKESWYEKVIGGFEKYVAGTINGASKLYNDAKDYAKTKFKELNCNASGAMKIVNPVTLIQEAAGPEVCEALAGAAFDIGMTAMGIPPSIPNMDDLTNMGIDYAVQMAIEKAGVNCDVTCQDLIKDGVKYGVKKSSEQNFVNASDWYTVKPDPKGFYRNAYVIITVKKTSNSTYKNSYPCGDKKLNLWISNNSNGKQIIPNQAVAGFNTGGFTTAQTKMSGAVYERDVIAIPFNNETPIGSEIKILKLLIPQVIYLHEDKNNKGKIAEFSNFVSSTKEQETIFLHNYNLHAQFLEPWRYVYSSAPVQFSFTKIQLAPALKTTFINPAFVSRVYWDDILDQ